MRNQKSPHYKQFSAKRLTLNCFYRSSIKDQKARLQFELWLTQLTKIFENYLFTTRKLLPPNCKAIEVNLEICGEYRIQRVNQNYRGLNKVTDVLSFPLEDSWRRAKGVKRGESVPYVCLGDILICVEQAQRQAKEYELSLAGELIHLLIHGLLHLLGFDHELSDEEQKIMEREEAKLLKKLIG